jgi:hypothetical protein
MSTIIFKDSVTKVYKLLFYKEVEGNLTTWNITIKWFLITDTSWSRNAHVAS